MQVIDYKDHGIMEIGRIGQPRQGTMKRLCVMVRENLPLRYVLQSCVVEENGELDPRIGFLFTPEDLRNLFDILKKHLNQ